MRYELRIGDYKCRADIDDPQLPSWRAVLLDAPGGQSAEGVLTVTILRENGMPGPSSRARLVPGSAGRPAELEGLEAFSG